jgi:hypothetical protein
MYLKCTVRKDYITEDVSDRIQTIVFCPAVLVGNRPRPAPKTIQKPPQGFSKDGQEDGLRLIAQT